MALPLDAVESLASRPGVRRVAVENFLTSLGGNQEWAHLENLRRDASAYRWNRATVAAIRDGIRMAYNRQKEDVNNG